MKEEHPHFPPKYEFRPPRDIKEGQDHYESALRIMRNIREEIATMKGMELDDPTAAPLLRSEMAALYALVMLDKDGFYVGPDYDLVAHCANMARCGYDVVDGEMKRVRKTREIAGGKDKATVT